jgi:hypothetical protein
MIKLTPLLTTYLWITSAPDLLLFMFEVTHLLVNDTPLGQLVRFCSEPRQELAFAYRVPYHVGDVTCNWTLFLQETIEQPSFSPRVFL